jgi:hypothetical protein
MQMENSLGLEREGREIATIGAGNCEAGEPVMNRPEFHIIREGFRDSGYDEAVCARTCSGPRISLIFLANACRLNGFSIN